MKYIGLLLIMAFIPAEAALEKFVDALPIPPTIQTEEKCRGVKPCVIGMTISQFKMKPHRDLPATDVWGYNGSSPGPTLETERDKAIEVHWENRLPERHLFPVPKGADVIVPDVRAVTHLHGAVVSQLSVTDRKFNNDGWPDAWTVSGEEQITVYPNSQSARMLWYHDHAMGATGRNVAAGLAGAYVIRDDYERSLKLPQGAYEIPLLLQTKQLNDDHSFSYVDDIANEFYGNVNVVNGKLWPYLVVEPRKYRFRIVNATNARSYGLKLIDTRDQSPGPAFYQIGTDAGFLARTAVLNDPSDSASPRLRLYPAERADVVIDFSHSAGRTYLLHNDSKDIAHATEVSLPEVMQIRVTAPLAASDPSSRPLQMAPIIPLDPARVRTTRNIVFDEMAMPHGNMLTLNGKGWRDPIEEKPILGTTEIWQLVNPLVDVHPFHIHLVEFQILDRNQFDTGVFLKTGQIKLTGESELPPPNEQGWKDTVRVPPGMVTRIIMRFAPYAGYYVYHCHILEHEDMEMMRPFQIIDPKLAGAPSFDSPKKNWFPRAAKKHKVDFH
jgi:spore coat protein A